MPDFLDILSQIDPVSLEGMEHVKLLDRVDTKYVIQESQLGGYLEEITRYYNVLDIDNKRLHPYETLYFDTPDFLLYRMHNNGEPNRYKLRCRKYVNTDTAFFEVKSKDEHYRTVKTRIQVDEMPEVLDGQLKKYIKAHTTGEVLNYVPVLRVYFERITLVNKQANERLTFDLNLHYGSDGVEKEINKIVIVEVKQDKQTVSPFKHLMKENSQQDEFLSKYCLGLTYMNSNIQQNYFNQKICALKKMGLEI